MGHQLNEAEGYAMTKELMSLAPAPDAVFCVMDLIALGDLEYLREQKVQFLIKLE
ncbi:hypothetical protein QWY93_14820 [Echinicola jeungdonensis]|uniref:Uncharacterized protein n=1 Tax=Echinicola jeungdonensis TaxID=709343 RepID=A0ABV5J5J3_9BACT|nr:hypothetical protein [Echinicola jeungdonensis]MDN3670593.1 hypothetical protein [Echinicola jeungdonensis]